MNSCWKRREQSNEEAQRFRTADSIDKDTRKLSFIPWGPDGAFGELSFNPKNAPSVTARSLLSRRIWATSQGRERYHAVLRDLLEKVWIEDEILAQVERFEERIGEHGIPRAFERLREFVRTRRGLIEPELTVPPDVTITDPASLSCNPESVSDVRVNFTAAWGDLEKLTVQVGNPVQLSLNGRQVLPLLSNASAGPITESLRPDAAVQMALVMLDGSLVVLRWQLGGPEPVLGESAGHGFESFGILLTGPDASNLKLIGFIGPGKLVFDQVGETVSGYFEGKLVLAAVVGG